MLVEPAMPFPVRRRRPSTHRRGGAASAGPASPAGAPAMLGLILIMCALQLALSAMYVDCLVDSTSLARLVLVSHFRPFNAAMYYDMHRFCIRIRSQEPAAPWSSHLVSEKGAGTPHWLLKHSMTVPTGRNISEIR